MIFEKIIVNHLDAIANQLQLQFGDWQQMPLIWAVLASSQKQEAKKLAI